MNQTLADLAALVQYVEGLEKQLRTYEDSLVSLNNENSRLSSKNEELSVLVPSLQKEVMELKLKLRPEWEVRVDAVLDAAQLLLQRHVESGLTLFPYKYGGNPVLNAAGEVTGGTFDCSAYTKYCYGIQGIVLPRTSKDQSTKGSFVPRVDVRKGDELFFDTDNDGVVNHCGIALDNGTMIHSNPSGKGVNIVSLAGYWDSKFIVARRHFS